jgi:predicted transcriptional regulator
MKKQTSKTKRAEGQTTLTISLPKELKDRIEQAASDDARSTSNFLVKELLKLVGSLEAQRPTSESSEARPTE